MRSSTVADAALVNLRRGEGGREEGGGRSEGGRGREDGKGQRWERVREPKRETNIKWSWSTRLHYSLLQVYVLPDSECGYQTIDSVL